MCKNTLVYLAKKSKSAPYCRRNLRKYWLFWGGLLPPIRAQLVKTRPLINFSIILADYGDFNPERFHKYSRFLLLPPPRKLFFLAQNEHVSSIFSIFLIDNQIWFTSQKVPLILKPKIPRPPSLKIVFLPKARP